jgi:CubicO group peptidase (beta-lactamase class C family)
VSDLLDGLDALAAETDFSGVVRVDLEGRLESARAYGFAHRGYGIANEVGTRFAIASGSKCLTALAVVRLIEDGLLDLDTTARSVLGADLPLIDERVTVEQLLSHRSGIGDYLDEEEEGHQPADYLMKVPVQDLATTEQYLAVLDGFPQKFEPGTAFSYCNGGYVVLALIAERCSGVPFHDLVRRSVTEPAGMGDTEFLRSDELPGRVALGYVQIDDVWRSNVFHLPVRGSGDGGVYTTVADISSFWEAFFSGRIVPSRWVAEMVLSRGQAYSQRYGLGFWLHATTDAVELEGADAGVSFRSTHDPHSRLTHTVVSNTSEGAWPISDFLADRLGTA